MLYIPNQVYIKLPDSTHNNFGLCIWHIDNAQVEKFLNRVKSLLIKPSTYNPNCLWFIQGKDDNWVYFEFHNKQTIQFQDWLMSFAFMMGEYMGLPVNIECASETVNKDVPDYCKQDNCQFIPLCDCNAEVCMFYHTVYLNEYLN